jgi:uncharacterized membrane protein YoaK (UPF0700 family)
MPNAVRPSNDRILPYLLLLLTVVAGTVDAVSYLALGHVFVVNMTGNIVFLGFAAAGAAEISLRATLTAMGAFLVGSVAGGRLALRFAAHDGRLIGVAMVIKIVLVAMALAVVISAAGKLDDIHRDVVIALLALAMGVQNASARRLGIPDLTTTVLTMTITAIAADSTLAGGTNPRLQWRLLAVGSMLLGAFAGGLCVLRSGIAAALVLTLVLLVLTGVLARGTFRGAQASR